MNWLHIFSDGMSMLDIIYLHMLSLLFTAIVQSVRGVAAALTLGLVSHR